MSKIHDFKNAPVGATATDPQGRRAVKTFNERNPWRQDVDKWTSCSFSEEKLVESGFTLDPVPAPAPTTVQEALDLAWELAHEVREGQVIPEGTKYLEFPNSELREYTAPIDLIIGPALVTKVRTHEPLPDPEPDWLDAPAVLAAMNDCSWQKVWLPKPDGHWECTCCGWVRHWTKMTDVTPLWPKEDKGGMYITGSGDIQFKDRNGQTVWEI